MEDCPDELPEDLKKYLLTPFKIKTIKANGQKNEFHLFCDPEFKYIQCQRKENYQKKKPVKEKW